MRLGCGCLYPDVSGFWVRRWGVVDRLRSVLKKWSVLKKGSQPIRGVDTWWCLGFFCAVVQFFSIFFPGFGVFFVFDVGVVSLEFWGPMFWKFGWVMLRRVAGVFSMEVFRQWLFQSSTVLCMDCLMLAFWRSLVFVWVSP